MEETMKRKSMIVAVLMASMVLGACGNKAETSATEDAVVSEAPTEEATTLESEETTEDTEQSAGEAQTDSSSSSESASTGSNSTTGTSGSTSSDKNSGNAAGSTTTGSSSAKQDTSSGSESAQAETGSQDSTQTTGVQAQYQVYEGVYFDEVIYTWSLDDSKVRPYYEIHVSNVTDTSFDFTIYEKDLYENSTLKFKTNTAVFTGDGTQAEFNGKGYHLVFTFPNERESLPVVTEMQVSGLSWLEGNIYCNNDIPGHEFG